MARKITTLLLALITTISLAYAQTPPYNEIWYTTTDGRPLFINSGYKKSVGLYMHSDTYNNGRGVLEFKSGGYINFINSGLFDGNDRLKSITIPNIVTSIGEKAFYRCYSLTSITCLATTPPAIGNLRIGETTMIYVPKEAVKAYKKDPNWSIYKKQIKAIK